MGRLWQKFGKAAEAMPSPVLTGSGKNKVGLIAYGSTEPAILEAMDRLAADGVEADFLRVRSLPLCKSVRTFVEEHDVTYVVEMNRDGQMHEIMIIDLADLSDKIVSIVKHDGLSLTARTVHEAIMEHEGN